MMFQVPFLCIAASCLFDHTIAERLLPTEGEVSVRATDEFQTAKRHIPESQVGASSLSETAEVNEKPENKNQGMVVFVLAPLTKLSVESLKEQISASKPRSIDIYTMSDTLRCSAKDKVGGQLLSQIAGCTTLLGEDRVDDKAFFNVFGEQFNQAWLATEWGSLMNLINGVVDVPVNVIIYPTQLFKNPIMQEVIESLPRKPSEFKKKDYPTNMGPIERYWMSWSNAKTGLPQDVFDLGPVVDFFLFENSETRSISLRSHAQEADWCAARQPNYPEPGFKSPMVYIDIRNEQNDGYCKKAAITEVKEGRVKESTEVKEGRVKVAVPVEREVYSQWAKETYSGAILEAMNLQFGAGSSSERTNVNKQAIFIQDSVDADNIMSVAWLLKKVQFSAVRLISISETPNYRIHKALFNGLYPGSGYTWLKDPADSKSGYTQKALNGAPLLACLEDLADSCNAGSCNAEFGQRGLGNKDPKGCEGAPLAYPYFASMEDVFLKHEEGQDTAWPALLNPKGEDLPQVPGELTDFKLIDAHNVWRWKEWLRRFDIPDVTVEAGGSPPSCPLSVSIIPYTFYFIDSKKDSAEFIRSFSSYQGLEAQQAMQNDIWRALCGMTDELTASSPPCSTSLEDN